MLKKILLGLVVVILLFAGFVATRPSHYHMVRELKMNATPDKIFPYLNSSKLMDSWGPWREVDPSVQMSMSGPEQGVGAVSSWDSKGQMGTGKATIVESVSNDHVTTKIEYTRPPMTQMSTMSIRGDGDGSIVSWSVDGDKNFIFKAMCVFRSMDKTVGPLFEKGLSNLKAKVEATHSQ